MGGTCMDCGAPTRKRPDRCGRCFIRWRRANDPEYRAAQVAAALRWNQAHPERHAAAEKARRERLGDEHRRRERERNVQRREQQREYRRAHRAANSARSREYRQRHPDEAQERWDRWYAANPDKKRASQAVGGQRRRARLQGQEPTLGTHQWLAIKRAYNYRCAYCGKRVPLTQDHVVPVSKGGLTEASNIVPACRPCNSRKHNRPAPILPAVRLML